MYVMQESRPQPDRLPLPLPLLKQIAALQEVLTRNGIVQHRGEKDRRPSYRRRFRDDAASGNGTRHHRSIALPDERAACAVRGLLEVWRAPKKAETAARGRAEAEARVERQRSRQIRREVQERCGGGRRRRKRIVAEYEAAVKQGPWEEFGYLITQQHLRPNKTPGKKPKSGLVLPTFGAHPDQNGHVIETSVVTRAREPLSGTDSP